MDSDHYVHLDYTVSDLYSLDGGCASNIVLVLYSPYIGAQERFIYQTVWDAGFENQDCAILDHILLQLRYSYSAGQTSLILPNLWDHGPDAPGYNPNNSYNNFQSFKKLSPDQRPVCKIVRSFDDIVLPPGCQIAVTAPIDSLFHLPHTIHPDIHYELLSKRGLALSNLPMPKSVIIDPAWTPDLLSKQDAYLHAEVERILKLVDSHPLPFILKLPQTVSGLGTFKVCSEADRHTARTRLHPWLQHMLKQITPSNQHLQPCSLVLQELVQGSAVALSLFITKKGHAVFVACCDQLFDTEGEWTGGTISYKQQGSLEKEYSQISAILARFLHEKGYHGPAGADIMTDGFGKQYIVDLNVRLTGTYNLGPLQGHFTQRNLWEAMTLRYQVRCSQEAFEREFDTELRNGSLIIMGWIQNETKDRSFAGFTLGAESLFSLKELAHKVKVYVEAI